MLVILTNKDREVKDSLSFNNVKNAIDFSKQYTKELEIDNVKFEVYIDYEKNICEIIIEE